MWIYGLSRNLDKPIAEVYLRNYVKLRLYDKLRNSVVFQLQCKFIFLRKYLSLDMKSNQVFQQL